MFFDSLQCAVVLNTAQMKMSSATDSESLQDKSEVRQWSVPQSWSCSII